MIKLVLLDRDGVINVDLPTGVLHLADLALIPGAANAIAMLKQAGYIVAVCTNQACVGRGELCRSELERINKAIDAAVNTAGGSIDGWFICTHRAEAGCDCRKPQPGLLLQACDAFDITVGEAIVIGDAKRDMQAAQVAGCKAALVLTGKGTSCAHELNGLPHFTDLCSAAESLCKEATR